MILHDPADSAPTDTLTISYGHPTSDRHFSGTRWWAARNEILGDLVDEIVRADRAIATAQARRLRAVEAARVWAAGSMTHLAPGAPALDMGDPRVSALVHRDRTLAERAFVSEVACALKHPEVTTKDLVEHARTLVLDHPTTLAALESGEISARHTEVVVEHTIGLEAADRAALEARLVDRAKISTVSNLRRFARRERERTHPRPLAERHREKLVDRRVQIDPARDGMMWLHQYLPAAHATAIYNRLTDTAVTLQAPEEPRTLTQLRADVFTSLLLDDRAPRVGAGAGVGPHQGQRTEDFYDCGVPNGQSSRGIVPTVAVTVPVLTLLGTSAEPGHLEGYGPIDPATAREIAARATSFTRILTHPETGAVLSVGRQKYAVPADLKAWLRLRDETCRFPGCSRRAARCDIDHLVPWHDGGSTDHDNLVHLCRHHHRLKHESGWTVQAERPGDGRAPSRSGPTPSSTDGADGADGAHPSTPATSLLAGGALMWRSPAGKEYREAPTGPREISSLATSRQWPQLTLRTALGSALAPDSRSASSATSPAGPSEESRFPELPPF